MAITFRPLTNCPACHPPVFVNVGTYMLAMSLIKLPFIFTRNMNDNMDSVCQKPI